MERQSEGLLEGDFPGSCTGKGRRIGTERLTGLSDHLENNTEMFLIS